MAVPETNTISGSFTRAHILKTKCELYFRFSRRRIRRSQPSGILRHVNLVADVSEVFHDDGNSTHI
jgi:hypothetical protein